MVTVALMALASFLASAYDPSPLEDTCVAVDEPKNAGISIVTNDVIAIFSTTLFYWYGEYGLILRIHLFFFPSSCSICKWEVLQEPKPDRGRGFLVSRAEYSRKHIKLCGLNCQSYKCWSITRRKHSWGVTVSYRLWT